MGGTNSGRPRLSDKEKIARGTFQPAQSEAVYAARDAQKVIVGPWLTAIPEPSITLNSVGRAEYDKLTRLMFNGNKLTEVTCGDCERMAVMKQQMEALLAAGKPVPMQLINAQNSISVRLRIAEDAPAIANPNQKNRFAGAGCSNSRSSPISLRPHSAAGVGRL